MKRHEVAGRLVVALADNHARHPCRRCTGRIGVATVDDDQHLRRVQLPACRGDEKTARVRLEAADLWIGGAEDDREPPCHAARLQLQLGRVVRETPILIWRRLRKSSSGTRPAARQRNRYFNGRSIIRSTTIASTWSTDSPVRRAVSSSCSRAPPRLVSKPRSASCAFRNSESTRQVTGARSGCLTASVAS